jgi:hypothetical protein
LLLLLGGPLLVASAANPVLGFDEGDASEFEDLESVVNEIADGGGAWVGSSLWKTDHSVVAATPNQVHSFDLRSPAGARGQMKVQLVPRNEWVLTR